MKNELLVASAGAGKTTYLVREALNSNDTVLITTFTEENEKEIRKKFIELNKGIIPSNVTIKTWFSFLLEHGAKPYQGKLMDERITGLLLVNGKSGQKYLGGKYPVYYSEKDVKEHYFTRDFKIYSDKLAKFVVQCNEKSNGSVIERISAIFRNVYIDEVQDLAGYDLEVIKLFLQTDSNVKIAGDPRQVTYHSHFSDKYRKYSDGKIQDFIKSECKSIECNIDVDKLKGSWRNNQIICDFANQLFPMYPTSESLQEQKTEHDGVFLVKQKDLERYLKEFTPTQLRDSRTRQVIPGYEVMNFGESKGATRDRVIIYPTSNILSWILTNKDITSFKTKCKFYVAITRARYSVAIVCANNINTNRLPIYD